MFCFPDGVVKIALWSKASTARAATLFASLVSAWDISVQSALGRDGDTQALAELERKIAELLKKETQTLRDMVGVFDKEQISMVAADLRKEREQMQRKAGEIRARLAKHTDLPDLSPDALKEMPKSAVKDALRRAVQWIAVGKEG